MSKNKQNGTLPPGGEVSIEQVKSALRKDLQVLNALINMIRGEDRILTGIAEIARDLELNRRNKAAIAAQPKEEVI